MSKASDLLDSLTEGGIMMYTASPETEPHVVVKPDRTIVVPDELKRIAVQYDHNVETVTFDCPRYWDEHDLSGMEIHINYELSNGAKDRYKAENIEVDENDISMMHFSWRISNDVTEVAGSITILVCIRDVDENGKELLHWNSELNKDMYVSAGMCPPGALED